MEFEMNSESSHNKRNQIINEAKSIAIENKGKLRYRFEWVIFLGLFIAFSSFFAGFGIAAAMYLVGLTDINIIYIGALVGCFFVLCWPQQSKMIEAWYLQKEIETVSKNAI